MASRRLDISSLLCDDTQPAFSPLDALVQAATEERKRLDDNRLPPFVRSIPPPPPSSVDTNDHHHVARSPVMSRYHMDDTRPLPQQPLYLQRTRVHHDHLVLQEPPQSTSYAQYHHHSREGDYSLFQSDCRRRIQEDEHQQRIHEQQRIQGLEYQRQQENERVYHAQELERRRREEEQLRALEYQHQRELELREAERQQQYRLLEEKRREAERKQELEREVEDHRRLERDREVERSKEIERLRQQQQQQHDAERQRVREDLKRRSFLSQDIHSSSNSSPATVSPLSSVFASQDPSQIRHSSSLISPSDSSAASLHPPLLDDPRPVKRRRYSMSPTRPIPDDQDRLAIERERMVVGGLGYGRVDSPIALPSVAPRRPGSGHNHARKGVAVADILDEKPPLPPPPPSSQLARRDTGEAHRILSPTGRRSPPGSQIGRAKAARKSDDYIASLKEHAQPTPKEPVISPNPPETIKVKEESRVKQEPNRPLYGADDVRHTSTGDESRPKKPTKEVPPPPPSKMHPSTSKTKQQDDPHEWFLHQYDEVPAPTKSAHPDLPGMPSPSIIPITTPLSAHTSKSPPPPAQKAHTPIALEQELVALLSSPTSSRIQPALSVPVSKPKKEEELDDMDLVDRAVTELVEILENDSEKHIGMEVDVEAELLSLVDDRPPPVHSTASSRRPSRPTPPISNDPAEVFSAGSAKQQQQVHRSVNENPIPSVSTSVTQSVASLVRSSSSTRATSERDSMPPPATTTTTKGGAAKKAAERASSAVPSDPSATTNTTTTKRKKEATTKASNAKSKSAAANAKPKAKSTAKSKKATAAETTSTTGRATPPTNSKATKGGSRSASVIPAPTKQEEEEEEEAENEDDKLYCICKTKYDESRFMIACDKCDEWYHTHCVNMPDVDVDLVDQFFCPSCIEKNPHLNLQTTYKHRCLWGLRYPDPDSPKACHKAARGAFSKYCSEECGVKYMQSRIDNWAKKGGKTDKLRESVKHAEKREGVVVCATDSVKMETDASDADAKPVKPKIVRPSKTKIERETERLNNLLSSISKMREEIQRGMEIIVTRERLLQLASERAELVGQCGWDQRLCCDDDELADIWKGTLESYDEPKADNGKGEAEEDGDVDMESHDEQWWCPGNKVCERHAGWQTIRYKDVCKEKEMKEAALARLTTRENELRRCIEDMLNPHAANSKKTKANGSSAPLKSSTAKLVNGHSKSKAAATEKKSRKRKAQNA